MYQYLRMKKRCCARRGGQTMRFKSYRRLGPPGCYTLRLKCLIVVPYYSSIRRSIEAGGDSWRGHASVASFNTSSCSLGLHSCPIKPSSCYLCIMCPFPAVTLSVCPRLVKIYFYQMLSALLTSDHLSHCSSTGLIRFASLNMKSTIQEGVHGCMWKVQITGDFLHRLLQCSFLYVDISAFWYWAWATQGETLGYLCTGRAGQAFICDFTKHDQPPWMMSTLWNWYLKL